MPTVLTHGNQKIEPDSSRHSNMHGLHSQYFTVTRIIATHPSFINAALASSLWLSHCAGASAGWAARGGGKQQGRQQQGQQVEGKKPVSKSQGLF